MIDPSPMWGLIEFVALLLLCMASVPIAFSMGIVGVIFAWLYLGGSAAISLAASTAWTHVNSYTMSMIPLFVLLGAIVGQCGLGKDAFDCFYKWLCKWKGGLAMASTLSAAAFGAVSGSSNAAVATIGGIAVPETKRYGYSRELRLGSIAVCGTLASLIPPSITAILYCVLTNQSVGKVFMAGLVPGLIMTVLFSIVVYIWVSLRPSIAPVPDVSFSLKEKLSSLKAPLPIFALFLGMIMGIYNGWFSPTEAAGIGVLFVVLLNLAMRRLNWQRFMGSMYEALRITAMLMLIIMGAMLFSATVALTGFPDYVADILLGWGLAPIPLIFVIIALFIALGCVLDVIGLLVLFVPLFYPTIVTLGYSPIWYGTMAVVLTEVAMITPPIAVNLYIAQALESDATVMDVSRGVLPFYAAAVVLLVLLVFFPQLATWLPSTM